MAATDSLLGILVTTGADQLRLVSNEPPKMSAHGAPRPLAMPAMSEEMLRQLLGPLLTPEREAELGRGVTVSTSYYCEPCSETFDVTLRRRRAPDGAGTSLEAVFVRAGRPARPKVAPAHAPASAAPARPSSDAASDAVVAAALAESSEHELASAHDAGPVTAGDRVVVGHLADLLAQAREMHASDVHLIDGAAPVMRVDGALRPVPGAAPIVSVRSLFADLRPDTRATASVAEPTLDGAFDLADARVRYSVYRTARGTAAALRLLPRLAPLLTDLHLPLPLADLALLPHGLVIVCGPTGCGKSATLAALAREAVRRRPALLITLEDPIEYSIPGERGLVRQREVGRDARDFAGGLRDALRGDPDVLLVGEMRDSETIALALTAAETGHLVLTSLHSRSASAAIERIVDGYPSRRESEIRAQLAQALRAVVAQRLLPRAAGGRAVALEVLRVNHSVGSLIREGRTAQLASVLQSSRREGMLPLEASLADLIRAGTITREAALAVANDPEALGTYVAG